MFIKQRLLQAIRQAGENGLTIEELIDVAYGHNSEGGHLNAKGIVREHIYHINKDLAALELQIRCIRIYRIESRNRR